MVQLSETSFDFRCKDTKTILEHNGRKQKETFANFLFAFYLIFNKLQIDYSSFEC